MLGSCCNLMLPLGSGLEAGNPIAIDVYNVFYYCAVHRIVLVRMRLDLLPH